MCLTFYCSITAPVDTPVTDGREREKVVPEIVEHGLDVAGVVDVLAEARFPKSYTHFINFNFHKWFVNIHTWSF